ncbi:hypothetical protein [Treponema pedis]|uniref:PsbP C-terminal domain-containing protein n=1 Tax=Treponema pedis str. T A4 TaxID=1291379 RepID=S6A7R1_9SPIR|nr:hypothetical protein [Treponema pedis]AGT42529.1 hypothetical protein TPE_0026 [Treponema pedis str. T A4]QSI03433.1 hypothetical protein DYQ05_00115 [Treponema pedis]
MKKMFIAVLFCTLFFAAASAQNSCTDKSGNFTFIMPDGWTAVNVSGAQYKLAAGLTIENFTQNISAVREKYSGTLEEYVEEAKKNILNSEILKEEEFGNDYNAEAKKIVFETVYENLLLKQYLYIFKIDNVCFLFTCSCLADEPEEIEDVFDESMKTFHTLHKEM